MNALNQNNTNRAFVMVCRFMKNIAEMYLASSGPEPGYRDWGAEIKFEGAREVYLCEFQGARGVYSSVDQTKR